MKYIYIFTFFQNLFFSILGTKDCPSKEKEGNEITLEDLKEGFERLKIKVEDNKIILRILDKLRGRCLHDIGEESLQYVMNYAKKFHPKMTTLNQDFVDALADSIGEFFDNDFCLEDSDSDYEPPPKLQKPGSR